MTGLLADPAVRSVVLVRARVGLGDLLASGPALRALRAARPDLHVALLTYPQAAAVVERQRAWIDELVAFPGYPGIPDGPVDPAALPGFLACMRGRSFDAAVQMYGRLPAANDLTEALGARRVGGFVKVGARGADLATHLPYPERRHEVHRHLDLLEHLGVPRGSDELELPLASEDIDACAQLLQDCRVPPDRYVLIHPGATAASRRWVAGRFAEVAAGLARDGWTVVVTGVPGEEELTAMVARAAGGGVVDVCGRTTLGSMAALVAGAALVIGNDSGPAHLAAAMRTPSVTVFQAGDPVRWAGLDRTRHRIVVADVSCRPCGLLDCPIDLRCAFGVAASTVLGHARHLLAEEIS